ncbi:MAG: pteridine-dependent deoxygenase [Rhodanobacteraceae bacterium]
MDVDGNLPPLRVEYDRRDAHEILAEPDVLAVFGFGAAAPLIDDPRWLRIALEPLAEPFLEVWRTHGPLEQGANGNVHWSSDENYCRFSIELDEASHGGIAGAAEKAYRELGTFVSASATPHVLRLWNYLDAINAGNGDEERYRQFCAGRARGMYERPRHGYPAATAIGRRDGARILQVYGLAARHPGISIENPRQVSAWQYPRRYGATPPIFARAMHSPAGQLLISGTAAVVGHASTHQDDLAAQLEETASNLASLLAAANVAGRLGSTSMLKVYVRETADASQVVGALQAMAPDLGGLLPLAGDICRAELLVEVDGVHNDVVARTPA